MGCMGVMGDREWVRIEREKKGIDTDGFVVVSPMR